jgi:hypothetical protein
MSSIQRRAHVRGPHVFAALCDKPSTSTKLNIVPQLAQSYTWSADGKALMVKVARRDVPRRREAPRCRRQIQHRASQEWQARPQGRAGVTTVDVVDPMTARSTVGTFSPPVGAPPTAPG